MLLTLGPKESTHPRGGSSICVRVYASAPTTCGSRLAGPGVWIAWADPDARILARGSGVRIPACGSQRANRGYGSRCVDPGAWIRCAGHGVRTGCADPSAQVLMRGSRRAVPGAQMERSPVHLRQPKDNARIFCARRTWVHGNEGQFGTHFEGRRRPLAACAPPYPPRRDTGRPGRAPPPACQAPAPGRMCLLVAPRSRMCPVRPAGQ